MNDTRELLMRFGELVAWLTGVLKLDGRGGGRLDVTGRYRERLDAEIPQRRRT